MTRWVLPARLRVRSYLHRSGCWVWTGCRDAEGYGRISINGRTERTHRVAWEYFHERPIPPGMTIDHLCRRTSCMRPDHLELVTRGENTRRRNLALSAA